MQGVQQVTDLMNKIATAWQEQSSGIEQINKTVAQMDQMTQQNGRTGGASGRGRGNRQRRSSELIREVAVFRGDASLAPAMAIDGTRNKKLEPRQTAPASPPRAQQLTV
jgi:uncharacterized phage infection (PIP) family protein YhgE